MKPLIGPTGLAKQLGKSRFQIHRMIAKGAVPEPDFEVDGNQLAWRHSTIDRWDRLGQPVKSKKEK